MSDTPNSDPEPPRLAPVRRRIRPVSGPLPDAAGSGGPPPSDRLASTAAPAEAGAPRGPVGYGNPPEHSRWKKGQSGNPRGRPKAAKSLDSITIEKMTQRIPTRVGGREVMMMRVEALYLRALEIAAKGNGRILALLLQRYEAAVLAQAAGGGEHAEPTPTPAELSATDAAVLAWFEGEVLARDKKQKKAKK